MTQSQDLLSRNMKRNARREDKSNMSLVSVSTASSNLSDPSQHRNIVLDHCQQFPVQMSSLAQDSNATVSTKNQSAELINSSITDDPSKTQSEFALSSQGCSQLESDERLLIPQHNTELPSPQTKTLSLDLLSQTSQDTPYNQIVVAESSPVLPASRSPQLEQFIQDTLNPTFSESSDESPEVGDGYFKMVKPSTFEDLPPEKLCPTENTSALRESVPSEDTNQTDVGVTTPALFQESFQTGPEVVSVSLDQTKTLEATDSLSICISSSEFVNTPKTEQSSCDRKAFSFDSSFTFTVTHDGKYDDGDDHDAAEECSSSSLSKVSAKSHMAEEHEADLGEERSTTGIHQELHESNRSSEGAEEETSTKSLQDQLPYIFGDISLESLQTEDSCSQSLSDLTPETVTSAKHFSFGEQMPYPGAGNYDPFWDEDRTATTQHSGEYLTVINESFASESSELEPRAEGSSSTSDGDYCIPPGYEEISVNYNPRPSQAAEVVHSDTDSPVFEYSDPEPYFDCKQGASDFSEVEPDEPKTETISSGDQLQGHSIHAEESNKMPEKSLLSSGSEDYEDAPYIQDQSQNFHRESEEESVHYSEASDEEFSLCESSQLLPDYEAAAACKDDNNSLAREVAAELEAVSESSDEEFLTTRIVRRRVVIQADQMPDLPDQSVTEEKYKDENGHIVVKRVTRKVIRKCVSADGAERMEVPSEGAWQESSGMLAGDGYSKVVKRTVLKSEGDHTEVTFDECEGLSAPQQGAAGSSRFSLVERTTVVEGERTMTHQGDPSLASDLPSAQDDFKQALGYINVLNTEGLPHVVERETVKEDGTVVRRAHMREGRTLRRTVVKGAGRRKRVIVECVDNPAIGCKPHNLQHNLHQLFHRYLDEEEEEEDDSDEEE